MSRRRRRRRGPGRVEVYGDPHFTGVPSLPLELALDAHELEYLVRVLAGRTDDVGRDLHVRFRNAHTKAESYVREIERRRR